MPSLPQPDLASPRFKADPHPFYARLRAEAPVHRVTLPDRQTAWLVTRYPDVAAAFRDERFAKDRANAPPRDGARPPWVPGFFRPLTRNMLDLDPPDHTRLRALVHRVFTPRRVEEMRERVQRLADELLDRAEGRGRMDLVREFALPIPATIIAELLGIPARDHRRFHRWSSAIVAANASSWGTLRALPGMVAFLRYIRKLIAARRAEPRDDLLSALVQAEEAGDRLSEDELLAMSFLLLAAGHETTVNLIGSGVLALLQHPGQMERLRQDPALIAPAVEELARFTSPVELATERYAREDIDLGGVTIPRGGLTYLVIASANRDEQHFPDPQVLDLARDPNRHLAFGLGLHYCMGAPLARLEAQIAISTLLRRLPELRLAVAPEALRWRRNLVLRGLRSLPVAFASR